MDPTEQQRYGSQNSLISSINSMSLNSNPNQTYVPSTPPRLPTASPESKLSPSPNHNTPNELSSNYSQHHWQSMHNEARGSQGTASSWRSKNSNIHTPPRGCGTNSRLFEQRMDPRDNRPYQYRSPQHFNSPDHMMPQQYIQSPDQQNPQKNFTSPDQQRSQKQSNSPDQQHNSQQQFTSPDQRKDPSPQSLRYLASPSTELTSTAAPFIPGRLASSSSKDSNKNEKLVQVTRGGCIFFVPESQLLLEEQQQQQHGRSATNPTHANLPNEEWDISTIPAPSRRNLQYLFAHSNLRDIFDHQNEILRKQMPPNDERYKEIPSQFSCIFPLDDDSNRRGTFGSFGYPTFVYKVISQIDGMPYALRRVDNIRTTNEIASSAGEIWRRVRHANIVTMHRAFVSNGALFFLHTFYPGAESLKKRYLDQRGSLISESLIWTYLTQIVSALRAIHIAGLACRVIDPLRILLSGQNRLRINGVGVIDVLEYDTKKSVPDLQREDIASLGRLILSLMCRRSVTSSTVNESMSFVSQHYSRELCSLTIAIITKPTTIYDICGMMAGHLMEELDRQYLTMDALEMEISKEYQNGRLLLQMLKLGLINERPEYNMDSSWAETGDRYLIKLFRDYVFHQVGEDKQPVIDYGHIIESLNKLDVGDSEKILLTSRDEKSILVASFDDIKKCIEKSFNELVQKKSATPAPHSHAAGVGRGGGRLVNNSSVRGGGSAGLGMRDGLHKGSRGGAGLGIRGGRNTAMRGRSGGRPQ